MICKGEVDKLKRNLPFFSQKWYAFRFKWALVFASYVYLMSSWLIILYLLIIHFFSPDSLLLRQYPDETEVLTPLMWTLCPQCVRFVHLQLIEKKNQANITKSSCCWEVWGSFYLLVWLDLEDQMLSLELHLFLPFLPLSVLWGFLDEIYTLEYLFMSSRKGFELSLLWWQAPLLNQPFYSE